MPTVEIEDDAGLLELTGGQEIDNIPASEVDKLNEILGYLLRKSETEFTNGMGQGVQRKGSGQKELNAIVFDRVGGKENGFSLRVQIMAVDEDKKGLENLSHIPLNSDGLQEITVSRVSAYPDLNGEFPFVILPENKAVLQVMIDNKTTITIEPEDLYSLIFVPKKEES